MTLAPGTRLGHYEITSLLGTGGMGEVYRAKDEHLDRDIAIKVLPAGTLADEQVQKRFRKEALALSKLNHPNIATVHDFDTQGGVDFIVMELVEGGSLVEKIKTGPLAEKEILELGAQIADALEEAHERGIVHRDLKPGNIAVTLKGRVKVLDFGLARMLKPLSDEATTEALTQEHSVAGTLPYMSPEELRGERADHRSDLYSFGVVLYEMATGHRPFEEKLSTALTNAIINKSPEPPSFHNRKVSPGLENIIVKALDKDPDHRYQSAREMRVDLERLTAPVSGNVPTRERLPALRWLWAAGGTAAVLAILFALNVGGLRDRLVAEPSPRINSIAVLPLENLSGDPEQEFFADGMTDALIGDLANIGALKVISRTSTMRYKGARKPLPEIARELRVDAIVEGTVLRVGDRVRIMAQLIHAETDQHLWAQSYERDLQDVLALQSEVARKIAQEVNIVVTPEEESRLTSARTVDPEAYEAYLKGKFHRNQFTADGFEKGLQYLQQAIVKDPLFPLPLVDLAFIYIRLGVVRGTVPQEEARLLAKASAMKALDLDEALAEAHTALGRVRLDFDWDWDGAGRSLRRAIELNPNSAEAHHSYALYLEKVELRTDEAISEIRRAQALDPLSPIISADVGVRLMNAKRYDEAIAEFHKVLELQPDFRPAFIVLGNAYQRMGMYEEAIRAHQKAGARMQLAYSYVVAGRREEAEKILLDLDEAAKRRGSFWMASIHVALGQMDEAFKWLETAYEERRPQLMSLRIRPELDPIRDDPRFQDLLRRMNFPE